MVLAAVIRHSLIKMVTAKERRAVETGQGAILAFRAVPAHLLPLLIIMWPLRERNNLRLRRGHNSLMVLEPVTRADRFSGNDPHSSSSQHDVGFCPPAKRSMWLTTNPLLPKSVHKCEQTRVVRMVTFNVVRYLSWMSTNVFRFAVALVEITY